MVIDYSFGSNNDSDFRSICMFKHWTNSLISVICSHTIFLILIPFIHPSILTFICEAMEFFRNLGQNFFLMKILYLKKNTKKPINKYLWKTQNKKQLNPQFIIISFYSFMYIESERKWFCFFFWLNEFFVSRTHTHTFYHFVNS